MSTIGDRFADSKETIAIAISFPLGTAKPGPG
jgi:hypothetical protein